MKFIGYNLITEDITVTTSSRDYEYPYTNLFDTFGSQIMKFTGYTDEWIVFDAGAGNTFDLDSFGIVNHNIDSGATITLQGNATDAWGGPTYSEALTWREELIYEEELPVFSFRFMRLRIQNSGSTNIYFGNILAGLGFEIPNIISALDYGDDIQEDSFVSGSGNIDGSVYYNARTGDFQAVQLSNDERKELKNIWKTIGSGNPVIGAIWEEEFDFEGPLYFSFEKIGKFKKNHYKWNVKFSIREAA